MVGSEDTDANGSETTSSSSVCCSICLDLVTDVGDRSRAKLQCGHEFHLDCIGSAFNIKGAMQCPNCREVEKGRWVYATGSTRSFPEFRRDEWTPDEDPHELTYFAMPFRVHWCPFLGLTRAHSSFGEVESPLTYHNLQRHHPIFAEHTAALSVAHSYVAYLGPIPPASSNTNESVEDPNFDHHWNGISGGNEIFTARGFPVIDVHYQNGGQHSHPFSSISGHINSTDQALVPPATLRPARAEYDAMARSGSFAHPSFYGHGNSRSRERTSGSHAMHRQQPPGIPSLVIPSTGRFNGPSGGLFNSSAPGSSSQHSHGTENSLLNRIHAQERNHLSHIPVISFDRDPGWGSFHHAGGGSGSSWHRHWS